MLDSSPLPIPPPRKLKRSASAASLPSPPPSVEHPKKRTTAQRFNSSDSDTEWESEGEVEEATMGREVLGRKLLFPVKPSASDETDNPFLGSSKPLDAKDQLALDAASSPLASHATLPASPPLSRRKVVKSSSVLPKTPPPVDQHWKCTASELPVLDAENNPFLSDSPPRPRRPRSPRQLAEPPTMTYVFKGVKTTFPNPHYNLPDSVCERSRLPLEHPEYSPPPTHAPKRLFPEAYPTVDDSEHEDESSDLEGVHAPSQTPEKKPRMSKVFVDEAGSPLPDSGLQGIRGKTMDAKDIGRMAVGPIRGHR